MAGALSVAFVNVLVGGEVLVHEPYAHGTFSDSRRDAFGQAMRDASPRCPEPCANSLPAALSLSM
jgi:hypothetical protein